MKSIIEKLRAFHRKNRFALDVSLQECTDPAVDKGLLAVTAELETIAAGLEISCGAHKDVRLHRAQLMVEEVGECIEAMARRDEGLLCDGLADTQFVTIGTSETFGLPTEAALHEVCDSNLTKNHRKDTDHRLRDKGPDYCPPDMLRVLKMHRARRAEGIK